MTNKRNNESVRHTSGTQGLGDIVISEGLGYLAISESWGYLAISGDWAYLTTSAELSQVVASPASLVGWQVLLLQNVCSLSNYVLFLRLLNENLLIY